ncbi:uncharacterized membrane protein YidH (DUF202 family) [Azospirillum agricola]|uniref:hypothetical protein n=1 Tax=Azospirillum agricola TaxID=1720247 RepID=UPI001AEA931C|nr:hypothetical protein [Azospirillum agricola]MBP2227673.1 uncharacterized membrane protein YidH (DUF202 family) [Azospirillum agricola]
MMTFLLASSIFYVLKSSLNFITDYRNLWNDTIRTLLGILNGSGKAPPDVFLGALRALNRMVYDPTFLGIALVLCLLSGLLCILLLVVLHPFPPHPDDGSPPPATFGEAMRQGGVRTLLYGRLCRACRDSADAFHERRLSLFSSLVMAAIAFYAVGVRLLDGYLNQALAAPGSIAGMAEPFLTVPVSLKMVFADASLVLIANAPLRWMRRERPATDGRDRPAPPSLTHAATFVVYRTLMMAAMILALCISIHVFCYVMLA